jgi:hypothetical protein
VAEGSAGVQAVWILYTGKTGSAYHGTWAPLDLVQSMDDPTHWNGTLTLQSGENAGNILFMVQAVGGAGLTTLATNLGAYYSITPENATQLPPPAGTTLTLQSPPTSGTYLKNSSFNVLLQSNGQALAGQFVTLDIGGQQASGITNSSGKATLTLKLVVRPGSYTAQASFHGNSAYLGSNDTSAFTVNKDSTTLTVAPTSASVPANQTTPFVAVVRDSAGHTLGGKSVFFVIHNATNTFAKAVIADFQPPGKLHDDSRLDGDATATSVPGVFAAGDVAWTMMDHDHPSVMSCQVVSPPTIGPGAPTEVATNGASDATSPSSSMNKPRPPWAVAGARDSRWPVQDLDQIKQVPASAFEVVKLGAVQQGP